MKVFNVADDLSGKFIVVSTPNEPPVLGYVDIWHHPFVMITHIEGQHTDSTRGMSFSCMDISMKDVAVEVFDTKVELIQRHFAYFL